MKKIRHIQVKVWPEIVSVFPALLPFERTDNNKVNPVDFDFSNIRIVQSSSLSILLIHLLRIINESKDRKWHFKDPDDQQIIDVFYQIGFLKILLSKIDKMILFSNIKRKTEQKLVVNKSFHEEVILFPINELQFEFSDQKRNIVEEFREYLFTELEFLRIKYEFKIHILIQVLTEMAKNTADHAGTNAFFGMDISIKKEGLTINFSFGDLGIGINKNIRNALSHLKPKRAEHLGLVETYHFALTPGKTTKMESSLNRGIGMSIILDMSKEIGLSLSVFDAESRGVLSSIKDVTHSDLRRNFYHLGKGKNVGFYYFGTLNYKF